MSYEYFDDIATADIAFKANGVTLEEMFSSAGDAVMNIMIETLDNISLHEHREIMIEDSSVEMLLFNFLQEIIYYKDAEQLLLRVIRLSIDNIDDKYKLVAEVKGEVIDTNKHCFITDVKAITFHKFRVLKQEYGWESFVVVDV